MTSRLIIFCVLLLTNASSNVQASETPAITLISEDPVTPAFSAGPVRRTLAVANDAALNDVEFERVTTANFLAPGGWERNKID